MGVVRLALQMLALLLLPQCCGALRARYWWVALPCMLTRTLALAAGRGGRMPSLADRRSVSEEQCRVCLETGSVAGAAYDQGLATYRVPMALHALNRARLCEALSAAGASGVVLLEGGEQTTRYDTDHEPVFRQESYFQWLFGVAEPGCYGAVRLSDGEATLFVPDLRSETYEIFCGKPPALADFEARYEVEACRFVDDLAPWLDAELEGGETLHVLHGLNSDSGNYAKPASFAGDDRFRKDRDALFPVIADLRTIKTPAEIEVLRYVNYVSSMAHSEVMRAAEAGMMEYQLESLFQHHTYTHGGCRHMAYTCICACGPNPAVLHYGHAGAPNARKIGAGETALLDMGAEYHCYAADITCSFPVGAEGFTPDQRLVYEAVLAAQAAVYESLRPGAAWPDMHRAAERAVLEGLRAGGVVRGDVDAMLDADLGAVFMPHGLGHLIGLDTHDVGGYLDKDPPRSERPGLSKLRTARVIREGMVLTVEPGCYFIDRLLDNALADPKQAAFVDAGRLAAFRGSGGVRLEDDVVVRSDGVENLSICPRTVAEVLAVKGGGAWPPAFDAAPELRRAWVVPNPDVAGGPMRRVSLT